MAQYYVQVDDKNYIAKMAKALTDKDNPADWTQVTVATSKDIDFTNQFDKYYMDPQTHAVTKNHDTTTIGDVNEQLGQAQDTLTKQTAALDEQEKTINTLTQQNQQLQQALGEATKAQVQAQQQFTQTTQTFQSQFGDLTKQVVDLGKQVAALTPSK